MSKITKVPNITINEIPVKEISSAKSPDLTIDKKLVRVSRKYANNNES